MTEHHCEYYVGIDAGLIEAECGLPATETYHFSDGSAMYFCAKHWDEWVKEENDDLADFGRDSELGQSILEDLIRNGVISRQ